MRSGSPPQVREARDLCAFVDASPSPFHACAEAARRIEAAGFRRVDELEAWDGGPGARYVVRGGSLVAWVVPRGLPSAAGFRIVGAHTDSPNLRLKPRPDHEQAGFRQLGVDVYGGAIWASWLDRDLGLSGRVLLRGSEGPVVRLFRTDLPVLRIPQVAIHLNREVNSEGLKLNPQQHLVPVLGLADGGETGLRELLALDLDGDPADVLSFDLMCHDVQPARLVGLAEDLVSAPRLDNLASCHAALRALEDVREQDLDSVLVVSLFDHEEVGSGSHRGAQGPLLRNLLERVSLARGASREDHLRSLAASVCVSADMAHGTHPNYPEKHDPDHQLRLNAGPVVKINVNQRYASEGETEAFFQAACEAVDVPYQRWANRSDLACGSTIGPITAANLGVRTVDVGTAQLAMHSARELAGSGDPELFVRALVSFFRAPAPRWS